MCSAYSSGYNNAESISSAWHNAAFNKVSYLFASDGGAAAVSAAAHFDIAILNASQLLFYFVRTEVLAAFNVRSRTGK